ncbi:MAG: signal recognition particle protein [Acidobacteriota bacterium]|nr:signal recognition particle protein [Acidobacteriota bacterium]MDE3147532.1 signal recognition particle protein [Acidobacteriota bacterium]
MFDSLSGRLERLGASLRSRGRLSDADLDEALAEVRSALLEADVELSVVRAFLEAVAERVRGENVAQSLTPGQHVIKAVHEQLVEVLGGSALKVTYASRPPTVVLLAGLQGAGKTTTAAKLAAWFKAQGRQPYLVGTDLQRPAAVEQLRVLGGQIGVDVYSEATDPVAVARTGVAEAMRLGRDVVIIDTAGRLAIDEALMAEVRAISAATSPHYTFLVIDAVTGQDAVHTARTFHESLELSGIVVTKLDYDARGGAVLSARGVVGRPVVFASTGEKIADFDLFHPDRMASRILGMGDILSLIEQAERSMDPEAMAESAQRMMTGAFTLDDFMAQLNQIRKMGSLGGLMRLMPGMTKEMREAAKNVDDGQLNKIEAIIHSMTRHERRDPGIIDGSRRSRIAKGSGSSVSAVNQLLKQFDQMKKMMKQMGGGAMPQMPGPMGKMAQMAARGAAARGDSLPPGFEALASGMRSGAASPAPSGGAKGKKKKGGRVTPPKQR